MWLDTGDPVPEGFDAVIMVEVVHEVDGSTIELQSPVPPYQHVRPVGEDIVATELLLPQSHRLRPQDVAACAAAGLAEVPVRRAPKVALIPTGTELVPVGASPEPGQNHRVQQPDAGRDGGRMGRRAQQAGAGP